MKSALLSILLSALTINPQPAVSQPVVAPAAQIQEAAVIEAPRCSFAPQEPNQTMAVWITAYSSTPEETDDTPFTTASGSAVREGIVATNLFPFGTHITIPDLFGDRIFVVEDRMHRRKKNFLDIWMPSKDYALEFGIQCANISVVHENKTLRADSSLEKNSPLPAAASFALSSTPHVLLASVDALY